MATVATDILEKYLGFGGVGVALESNQFFFRVIELQYSSNLGNKIRCLQQNNVWSI
jgi:hypothetical protein